MSFFKRLFGGFEAQKEAKSIEPTQYKDFDIIPQPRPVSGQWQIAGLIRKTVGEEVKEQEFLRADTLPSEEEAISFTIRKGKQIIDEQGDYLFN